jgi:hypothetical protein
VTVDGDDHHIQPREHGIGQREAAVVQNIDLRTPSAP